MSIQLALAIAPEQALASSFVVFRDKIEVSLDKAARLGYDGVELALLHRNQIDMRALKRRLDETGLEIPMVSTGQVFADTGVSFSDPDKTRREKAVSDFTGLMEVASELEAQINIGRVRGMKASGKDQMQLFEDSMEVVLSKAEKLGVTIAMEPVNRYEIDFINSCSDGAEIIDALEHPKLKMMPDVFHMNIEDPSIEGSLWKYASKISYIHFADSNRWAPGRGHLDFKSIITALHAINYSGYAALEILPYPDPDTAAFEAIHYLRKYI